MKGLTITGAAVLAAVVTACAATGPEVPRISEMLSDNTGQNGRACVRVDDIQGYGVLEDNVISIDSMGGDYYLATILPGCTDLLTSAGVEFSGNFGEICGQSSDQIVTGGERCTINQVFEFDDREAAFDTYNAILEQRAALREDPSSG